MIRYDDTFQYQTLLVLSSDAHTVFILSYTHNICLLELCHWLKTASGNPYSFNHFDQPEIDSEIEVFYTVNNISFDVAKLLNKYQFAMISYAFIEQQHWLCIKTCFLCKEV